MAGGFWKAVGAQLFDAGAAYLQQVRLIEELKRLPVAEARERFATIARGLSDTARAGMSVTLAAMASQEQGAEAKRLIESLRQALANGIAPASSPTAPALAAAPKQATQATGRAPAGPPAPPRPAPSYDDDVDLIGAWCQLDGPERAEAVVAHLDGLDLRGLDALHGHIEEIERRLPGAIAEHRENEARIAAGRFVEDQMHYRRMRLMGAPPDADWQRKLVALQDLQTFCAGLREVIGVARAERTAPPPPAPKPPPPPPLASRPASPPTPAPRAQKTPNPKSPASNSAPRAPAAAPAAAPRSAPAPAAPVAKPDVLAANPMLQALGEMKPMLEQMLASGQVRGERSTALRRVLAKMDALVTAHASGELEPASVGPRIRQLFDEVAPLMADPGGRERLAQASERGRAVDAHVGALKVALSKELMASPPAATAEALAAVLGDLGAFQQQMAEVADDDALAELEATLLRPAVRAHQQLGLTRHALLARPLWDWTDAPPRVNTVAFAGAADLQRQLEAALAPRRLSVLNTRQLQNHGQSRWDDLDRCHVAVFDLRGASRIGELARHEPRRARELAGAAYELGLAFALGKPVVVLASAMESMPFDVDLSPVGLEGDALDAEVLAQAVDEAFYVPQRSGRSSSIGTTLAELDRLTADHPRRAAFEGMGWLAPGLQADPAGFAAAAEHLLDALPLPRPRLMKPSWPACYPEPGRHLCFHVMPFGPPWADAVRDAAQTASTERGYFYRRGDEADEGRIIHAIWQDICRAEQVLVDLTGANLNVMIELGMAHAIGRPVLAVQGPDEPDIRPRHIEKLRVLPYASPQALCELLLKRLPQRVGGEGLRGS